jgi:hypothetical protein
MPYPAWAARPELRPFRDAMDIGLGRSLRQRFERRPTPHPEQGTAKLKSQIPFCYFGLWRWARRRIGNSVVTYCPGGTRSFIVFSCRFDLNPREM